MFLMSESLTHALSQLFAWAQKFVLQSAKLQMFDDQSCHVWHPIRACFGITCSRLDASNSSCGGVQFFPWYNSVFSFVQVCGKILWCIWNKGKYQIVSRVILNYNIYTQKVFDTFIFMLSFHLIILNEMPRNRVEFDCSQVRCTKLAPELRWNPDFLNARFFEPPDN